MEKKTRDMHRVVSFNEVINCSYLSFFPLSPRFKLGSYAILAVTLGNVVLLHKVQCMYVCISRACVIIYTRGRGAGKRGREREREREREIERERERKRETRERVRE